MGALELRQGRQVQQTIKTDPNSIKSNPFNQMPTNTPFLHRKTDAN